MGRAVKAEIRKIFSTRLWWGLLIGLVLVSGGTSALFAALVGSDFGGSPSDNPFYSMKVGTAQLIYSAGFSYDLTPLIPLALGVLLITNEFRHKTISSTLLATPRRTRLMVAKALAIVVIGAVFAVVHDIAAAGIGSLVLRLKGQPTFLGDGQVVRTLAISLLCFVLWTLLGFGFGALVRNQLAAVFVALGVAFVAHIALSILFGVLHWQTPPKFLPDNLSIGMLVTSDPTSAAAGGGPSPYFSWWVSALILMGYAAVLAALGSVLLSRRDIA